jgi:signal transduction histidine kinase
MRERIEGLSGTLRVRSEPGSGTTVSALVPHATAEVRA